MTALDWIVGVAVMVVFGIVGGLIGALPVLLLTLVMFWLEG